MITSVLLPFVFAANVKFPRGACRNSVVVKALASHQYGPGTIPGHGVIGGLSLSSVLVLALRGFSPGITVFPSSQKPTFPNSNSMLVVSPQLAFCAK